MNGRYNFNDLLNDERNDEVIAGAESACNKDYKMPTISKFGYISW